MKRLSCKLSILLFTFIVLALTTSQSVAAPELLITNLGDNNVLRYNGTTGAFIDVFVSGGSGDPEGLAFGPDGNLYVSSFDTNEVRRYNGTTGAFIDTFVSAGSGGLGGPSDLVFGPDGNLYVVSNGSHSVLRYDEITGAFIDTFASGGGLLNPYGFAFGPDGNLYVCGTQSKNILRYNGTSGAFMDEFVPPGSGGLVEPSDVVFGPDGKLYVTSSPVGGGPPGQVLRYDGTTGAFIDAFVPAGSGGLSAGRGLAFGPDGNLYVTDLFNNRILRYDGTTGAFIDAFVPAGSGGLGPPRFLIFHTAPTQELVSLAPATLWIGLKNSDDQGTQFDLRAEVYKNNVLVTPGQTLCITGVTRNPNQATQAIVSFESFAPVGVASGDVLSLKIFTRIGTNLNGTKCSGPGGSHNNAVGLRLYYDAASRPSRFAAELTSNPSKNFYLHSNMSSDFLDDISPGATTAKFKDSAAVNFAGGNSWKIIGTWSMTLP